MKNGKKHKIKLIIVLLILIFISGGFLLMSQRNDNKNQDVKVPLPTKQINMQEVCKITIEGSNKEAGAKLSCDIPELEERKKEYEKSFIENLPNYIDTYTEGEKEAIMKVRETILTLNLENVCELDNSSNLENGDVINVVCKNNELKKLNYNVKNGKFKYNVKNLEEIPIDPVSLLPEGNEIVEEKRDLKNEASTWKTEDGLLWVNPADIKEYDMNNIKGESVVIMTTEENLEEAIKKALNSNVEWIVTEKYEYSRKTNFKVREDYKGVS